MTHTTEQLEKMLANATSGPWLLCRDEDGDPAKCVSARGFDIATAWGGYIRADADAALIAAAPTVTAELIAARKRIAELEGALTQCAFVFLAMTEIAQRIGLEGSSQWDELAGGTDLYGTIDRARAALGDTP